MFWSSFSEVLPKNISKQMKVIKSRISVDELNTIISPMHDGIVSLPPLSPSIIFTNPAGSNRSIYELPWGFHTDLSIFLFI